MRFPMAKNKKRESIYLSITYTETCLWEHKTLLKLYCTSDFTEDKFFPFVLIVLINWLNGFSAKFTQDFFKTISGEYNSINCDDLQEKGD